MGPTRKANVVHPTAALFALACVLASIPARASGSGAPRHDATEGGADAHRWLAFSLLGAHVLTPGLQNHEAIALALEARLSRLIGVVLQTAFFTPFNPTGDAANGSWPRNEI